MVAAYCAVSNCFGSKESKHRFPNPAKDLDRFKKWLDLCQNRRLLEMPPEKVYANCRVCKLHFRNEDFGPNNILLRSAYPSLKLPVSEKSVLTDLSGDHVCSPVQNLLIGETFSTGSEILPTLKDMSPPTREPCLFDNRCIDTPVIAHIESTILRNRDYSQVRYFEQPKLKDFQQRKKKVLIAQASNDKVKDTVKESDHKIHISEKFEYNTLQTRDESKVSKTVQNRCRSQIQCTQCPEIFNSLYAYKNHRRTKHLIDQIIQILAQKQIKLSGKILVMLKKKQRKQPVTKSKRRKRKQSVTYLCPYCGKLLRSNYSSKDHPPTHTCKRHRRKQINLCHICGQLFKTDIGRHIHCIHEQNKSSVPKKKQKQNYNPNDKVRCDICQKILQRYSLKKHQLWHTKPHTCVICDKSFVLKQQLVTHLQNNHKALGML